MHIQMGDISLKSHCFPDLNTIHFIHAKSRWQVERLQTANKGTGEPEPQGGWFSATTRPRNNKGLNNRQLVQSQSTVCGCLPLLPSFLSPPRAPPFSGPTALSLPLSFTLYRTLSRYLLSVTDPSHYHDPPLHCSSKGL